MEKGLYAPDLSWSANRAAGLSLDREPRSPVPEAFARAAPPQAAVATLSGLA